MLENKPITTVITSAVSAVIRTNSKFASQVNKALTMFIANDWGNCSKGDAACNDLDPSSAMGSYPAGLI